MVVIMAVLFECNDHFVIFQMILFLNHNSKFQVISRIIGQIYEWNNTNEMDIVEDARKYIQYVKWCWMLHYSATFIWK